MLDHHSEKTKHESKLTMLERITAKYPYDGANFRHRMNKLETC